MVTLQTLWAFGSSHLAPASLVLGRVVPVVLLCPLLGGAMAPAFVRIGVALSVTTLLCGAGGVTAHGFPLGGATWFGALTGELALGTSMGLVVCGAFEASRVGGRVVDLLRGASAEAALHLAGTRDSATGDLLLRFFVSAAAAALGAPLVIAAVGKSFLRLPPGQAVLDGAVVDAVIQAGSTVLRVGCEVAFPLIVVALIVDGVASFLARYGRLSFVGELSAPVKLLAGLAVVWLATGLIQERLLGELRGASAAAGSVWREPR
jgi:flagellar biosynthesis protein FliR